MLLFLAAFLLGLLLPGLVFITLALAIKHNSRFIYTLSIMLIFLTIVSMVFSFYAADLFRDAIPIDTAFMVLFPAKAASATVGIVILYRIINVNRKN